MSFANALRGYGDGYGNGNVDKFVSLSSILLLLLLLLWFLDSYVSIVVLVLLRAITAFCKFDKLLVCASAFLSASAYVMS